MQDVLPKLKNGTYDRIKQNEEEATYLLKRTPEDGLIDWSKDAESIHTLIKAASKPYPGAFSHYNRKHKVVFWRADLIKKHKYIGIPGQIAEITDMYIDIVAINGLLRVYDFENIDGVKFVIGNKFK